MELFQQQPGSFYADLEKILSDDCDGGRKTGKYPVIIETDNGHLFRYGDSPLIQQGDFKEEAWNFLLQRSKEQKKTAHLLFSAHLSVEIIGVKLRISRKFCIL